MMIPHDFRHTAASLSVSGGANVKAVQRLLGHSPLDVYIDLFDSDLDDVAEALDQAVAESLEPK